MVKRREFDVSRPIPEGHNQNWPLIEKVLAEVKRHASALPKPEVKVSLHVDSRLNDDFRDLTDARIRYGEHMRDVIESSVICYAFDPRSPVKAIHVSFEDSEKGLDESSVWVSGQAEVAVEDIATALQRYILEQLGDGRREKSSDKAIAQALSHVHPALRAQVEDRLQAGHGDDAVEEACKTVAARVREITGLQDDGRVLIGKALGGDSPSLRLNPGRSQSDRSEQEGFALLGMGLFLAARNPRAHRPADPNFILGEAVEWISVASLLHRALDRVPQA